MVPTGLQESLLTIKRARKCALTDSSRAQKQCFWCWKAAPDVAGSRSCSSELGSECVDAWNEGVVVGQVWVERSSLSLARALLRWNKPRLQNDIFSHPSNKLHIQQISGSLPNHFFPLQSFKKLHVGLDYRDIIQKIFLLFFISNTICRLAQFQGSQSFRITISSNVSHRV